MTMKTTRTTIFNTTSLLINLIDRDDGKDKKQTMAQTPCQEGLQGKTFRSWCMYVGKKALV